MLPENAVDLEGGVRIFDIEYRVPDIGATTDTRIAYACARYGEQQCVLKIVFFASHPDVDDCGLVPDLECSDVDTGVLSFGIYREGAWPVSVLRAIARYVIFGIE